MIKAPWIFLSACRLQLCMFMSIMVFSLAAQNVCDFNIELEFQQNFGGTNSEIVKNSRQTADGGYIIAGHTLSDDIQVSDNYGGVDYWLVKTDAQGNIQWEQNYGGSSTDLGQTIIQTDDEGYLFLGGALSNDRDVTAPKGSFDIWLLRLNANGDVVFDRSYGGTGNDRPSWMEATSDGGYVICATTSSDNGDVNENKGVTDVLVLKLDANLNVQWSKTVGGSSEDFANHIQQTSDGGYVVTGGTFSIDGDINGNNGDMEVLVFKLDANGNLMWLQTLGGSGLEWGNSIIETSNGDIMVTGATDSSDGDFPENAGFRDLWLARFNSAGVLLWRQIYGGLKDDMGSALLETPNNGFLVAGHAEVPDGDVSNNNGILDIWLLNTAEDGSLIRDYNYGGSMTEMTEDMQFTNDGGLLISGFSESNDFDLNDNKGQADYWILKFAPLGSGLITPNLGEDEFFCNPQNVFLNGQINGCNTCTYLWSDGNTSPSRVVFVEETSTYTITVTDQSGCSVSDEIHFEFTDLDVDIQFTNPAGCVDNGSILATASGGTGNYTYIWNNDVNGPINQNLPSGVYQLTLTDGECSRRETVLLTSQNANLPIFDLGENRTLCNGESYDLTVDLPNVAVNWSTGTTGNVLTVVEAGFYSVTVTNQDGCSSIDGIQIDVEDLDFSLGDDISTCEDSFLLAGLSNYDHQWSTGETGTSIEVNTSGTYSLTLTSPRGCSVVDDVVITFSDEINFSLGNDVEVCESSYVISGPDNASTYLWSNSETTQDIEITESGTYSVTISSGAACTSSSSIQVTLLDALELELGEDQQSCEPILLNPGVSQVDYNWSNNSTGVTLLALETGTYALTVTNDSGCSAVDSVFLEVNDHPAFALPDTLTSCESVNFNFEDTPYQYEWSHGPTGSSVELSETGDYMITVTGNGGCSIVEQIYVDITNELSLELGQDISSCDAIALNPGLGGLNYDWSTGEDTQEILITETGTYTLVISDDSGCSAADEIFVEIFETPEFELGEDQSSCEAILIEGPLSDDELNYLWSNGATTSDILVEENGLYVLTVSNDFGCSSTDSITVTIAASLNLDLGEDLVSCEGIEIEAGNFGPEFSYMWSDGSSASSLNVSESGIYSLTVSDALSCSATDSIIIQIEEPLELDLGEDQSACGSIELSTDLEADQYLWSTGETGPSITVDESGVVSLTVITEAGCESQDSIELNITEGFELEVQNNSLDCHGDDNGFINLSVEGANGSLNYLWEDGGTSEDRTNLAGGTYQVTVTDEAGCEQSQSIEIPEPAPLVIDLLSIVHISCDNTVGEINVEASGGTGALTYIWENINGQGEQLNVNRGGVYQLTVIDENNCIEQESYELFESDDLVVFVDSISGNPCPGLELGYLRINVVTGTAPYTYRVNSAQTGLTTMYSEPEFTNLPSGQYAVEATDATGCSSLLDFVIEAPEPIDLNLEASGTCGDFGFAFTEVVGGLGPYVYEWSTGDTTKFVTELVSGEYALTVVDQYDCSQDSTFVIQNFDEILAEALVDQITCHGADDGSIGLDITQGTGPYEYLWSNGSMSESLDELEPAMYTLTITDANGCTFISSNQITEPEPLNAQETIVDSQTDTDGSIEVVVTGGTAPYSFLWSNGSTDQNIDQLQAGTYMLTITDANGCTLIQEYEVSEIVSIDQNIIEDLRFFPNPTADQLFLQGSIEEDLELTLLDMYGRPVSQMQLKKGALDHSFDLNSYPAGVYMLQLKTISHQVHSYKIVKL